MEKLSTTLMFLFLLNIAAIDLSAQCSVRGGFIATDEGATDVTICLGSDEDHVDVTLTGNTGEHCTWVVTTGNGDILSATSEPPFSFSQYGIGTCKIFNLCYDGSVYGLKPGGNINDFQGCFDLSNPIYVTTQGQSGGELTTIDGATEASICAGDSLSTAFDVSLTGNSGAISTWLITDSDGNILDIPAGPPFNLEAIDGPDVLLIWNLSSDEEVPGIEVGVNAGSLEGCIGLSNPIVVSQTGAVGGDIALEDGSDQASICAGDGVADPLDVTLTGNSGTNSAWVITDADGVILDLPAGPPFDLDGAGAGVCLIWHLSFEDGLTGAEIGANANDLGGCFGLSNPITVTREVVDGGMVAIAPGDSTTATICVGDSIANTFQFVTTDSISANYQYIVTNDSNQVMAVLEADTLDFEGAGFGICRVYGVGFSGNLTIDSAAILTEIDLSDNCFALSSNFIEVTRDTSLEVCMTNIVGNPESSEMNIFPNPVLDELNVDINLREGEAIERVFIFNALGQVVYQRNVGRVDSYMKFRSTITIPNVETGVNILTVLTSQRSISQQFVKRRE